MKIFVSISLLFFFFFIEIYSQSPQNCSSYSALKSESYWDSVHHCGECTSKSDCGFCFSTMECMTGSTNGPSNGLPCPQWHFDENSCPGNEFSC
jgi:hypothetical protein